MRISDWSSDVCSSDLKGVLRLGEDLDQRLIVEILQRCDDRKAADEFGDQTEFQQILRLALAQKLPGAAFLGRCDMGAKADGFRLQPVANDLFQTCERAAADEEDVRRIHLQEFLQIGRASCRERVCKYV